MEEEIWRPVVGYTNYEVSNQGRVRNARTGKILKAFNRCRGYYAVNLCRDKKHYLTAIHRIVARAFPEICGEWFENCQINHKDENRSNNIATNLETCTIAYNDNYGNRIKKIAEAITNNPKLSKQVAQYTIKGTLVAIYPSLHEAERQTGINHSNIAKVCSGKYSQCNGFIWTFV